MGLLGILLALGFLIWLAYRGWSVLLLAPGVRGQRQNRDAASAPGPDPYVAWFDWRETGLDARK